MKYVTSEVVSSQGSMAKSGNIDWNDFNYPPCLKIFHYDPEQTPEVHKRRATLLKVNHILIIVVNFVNFIANIAGAAEGVDGGGIRIGISIFLFLFWVPVSFYLFFIPYHIIMKDEGKAIIFYVMSLITLIWFFIWAIADFADCNGFVMVNKNFQDGRNAAGGIGLIASIGSLIIAVLTGINVGYFYKR